MNDRQRAHDLLRRARDIVAERLTERVLANKDEILEDALGLAYSSEIDGIYEQLGVRLAHLNQLISSLPVEEDDLVEPAAEGEAVEETAEAKESQALLVHHGPNTKTPQPHLALPGPGEVLQLAAPEPEASFQRFASRIFLGELDAAAKELAELFELELPRARKCAQVFYDGVRHNPSVIGKAAQLRRNLQSREFTAAMSLLHDCFGLQGVESISVMQSLRARLERQP